MKTRILIAALGLYCALLIAAGWPVTATRMVVGRISDRALDVLGFFSIEPGLRLFYRPYDEPWKMRRQCFQLRFFGADNAFLKAEDIGEGCLPNRPFKWVADPLGMVMFRYFEEAAMERLHEADLAGEKAWRDENYRGPREASLYSVVGEHFCHSKSYAEVGAQRLVMAGGVQRSATAAPKSVKTILSPSSGPAQSTASLAFTTRIFPRRC